MYMGSGLIPKLVTVAVDKLKFYPLLAIIQVFTSNHILYDSTYSDSFVVVQQWGIMSIIFMVSAQNIVPVGQSIFITTWLFTFSGGLFTSIIFFTENTIILERWYKLFTNSEDITSVSSSAYSNTKENIGVKENMEVVVLSPMASGAIDALYRDTVAGVSPC